MASTTASERYAAAMGELWTGLTRTLTRLEAVALDPSVLDETAAIEGLRRLQYALHLASEHAYGLRPPHGAAEAHAELATALGLARDATAEVVEVASWGGAVAVEPLLHEWRGVLFGVRLARLRLAAPRPAEHPVHAEGHAPVLRPLLAVLLVVVGAAAVAAGAATDRWPGWVAGLVAVAASLAVFRP